MLISRGMDLEGMVSQVGAANCQTSACMELVVVKCQRLVGLQSKFTIQSANVAAGLVSQDTPTCGP